MKELNQALVAFALVVTASSVNASVEKDIVLQLKSSYACQVMLQRGSNMFCGDEINTKVSEKSAVSELMYVSSVDSYVCEAMAERGSEMFCQADKAVISLQADNR